jgi:hypothetical protein
MGTARNGQKGKMGKGHNRDTVTHPVGYNSGNHAAQLSLLVGADIAAEWCRLQRFAQCSSEFRRASTRDCLIAV